MGNAIEVSQALVTEIKRAASTDDLTQRTWVLGRCYGLALALAILDDTSTDEALDLVVDSNKLAHVWKQATRR